MFDKEDGFEYHIVYSNFSCRITLTLTITETYNWLKFMPGRRRNQQVMNRGRFQAQSDRLEKSAPWTQEDIPTKQMIKKPRRNFTEAHFGFIFLFLRL